LGQKTTKTTVYNQYFRVTAVQIAAFSTVQSNLNIDAIKKELTGRVSIIEKEFLMLAFNFR
jgi:hypothetical protein